MEWEQKFLDICEEGIGGGASVYYFAARSVGDIGGSAIDGDLQFLAGGYFLVIIYLIMALGKFNRRDQKVVFGFFLQTFRAKVNKRYILILIYGILTQAILTLAHLKDVFDGFKIWNNVLDSINAQIFSQANTKENRNIAYLSRYDR